MQTSAEHFITMKKAGKVQAIEDFNDIESPRRQRLMVKLQLIAENHGGKFLGVWRENSQTMGRFECIKGHGWTAYAHNIRAGHWCRICRHREFSLERCQEEAAKRNGKCLRIWQQWGETWGEFICNKDHPPWITVAKRIIRGVWCKYCALEQRKTGIKCCKQYAKSKSGRCLSAEYVNTNTKLRWRCARGHEWWARWSYVNRGYWCPKCSLVQRKVLKRTK